MSDKRSHKDKIIIGLTGNIATGKSAVMRMASQRGALTIDADKVVHDVLNNDPAVQAAIAESFGAELLLADGRVDRAALGSVVFNDAEALRQLETIVHPPVRQRIMTLITESVAGVVMIEAIKLLEGDLWTLCQEIWVASCSLERQLERLKVCRGMDEAQAAARIWAQSAAEDKIAQADVVIDTNGLMVDTERQFTAAWERLVGNGKASGAD